MDLYYKNDNFVIFVNKKPEIKDNSLLLSIKFNKTLFFNQPMEIGLVDIIFNEHTLEVTSNVERSQLYILCDIIEENLHNSIKGQLLRIIPHTSYRDHTISFENIIYNKVLFNEYDTINILITHDYVHDINFNLYDIGMILSIRPIDHQNEY